MAGVNKVILVGNLGNDPELRYTQAGTPVTNFRLATNESWYDKDGVKQERTEWHRIVAWAGLAENIAQYLAKGRQVYVEGKLQTRKWEKDGQDRYTTEIVALNCTFLGTRPQGDKDEAHSQEMRTRERDQRRLDGDQDDMADRPCDLGDDDVPF